LIFIGIAYEHGRGVEKDIKQSLEWFSKADAGHGLDLKKPDPIYESHDLPNQAWQLVSWTGLPRHVCMLDPP
jgi:TPR repeat protein